jgi:hypothetical protein
VSVNDLDSSFARVNAALVGLNDILIELDATSALVGHSESCRELALNARRLMGTINHIELSALRREMASKSTPSISRANEALDVLEDSLLRPTAAERKLTSRASTESSTPEAPGP